jgi:hypothetical protein
MNVKKLVEIDLPNIKKLLESQNKLSLAHDIETAIEVINRQQTTTEDTLKNIMSALQVKNNFSQEDLFEHCNKALNNAEKSLKS